MSRPEDENTKAKLEELILKTRADIYQCCKCLLWIVCISVGLLACWVGKVQYFASHGTVNMRGDSDFLSFNVLDKNGDGCISEHLELSQWGPWNPWSDCYMNCTGRHGGRIQNRSREIISHSSAKGHQTETEERPCNAVQFAGCIKDHGTDDNFGVNYDFADEIAISKCTTLSTGSAHVYSVRRKCPNLAVSCADTCTDIGLTCFNALHIYRQSTVLQRNVGGSKGLYTYKYNSCQGTYCGPNFCCCSGR